jgi:hypothetical protein
MATAGLLAAAEGSPVMAHEWMREKIGKEARRK